MTLEELYEQAGGSYKEALSRMMMPRFIEKYVLMFLDDDSCPTIVRTWEAGDERACFDAAHSAKGVCGNLALTKLYELSSEICEALREGNEDLRASTDIDARVAELKVIYDQAVSALKAYKAEHL